MESGGIASAVQDVANGLSFLPGWAVGPIILILAVVLALGVHATLHHLSRRLLARNTTLLALLRRTRSLSRLAFVTIAIALVLPLVRLAPDVTDALVAALRVIFVVLLGWIALIAVDFGATVYLARFDVDSVDSLLARKHLTQLRVLKRAVSTIVIMLTAGAALMTFDTVRQFGVSLFASAGVAGLVAGIAARPVLSNLIAGVQLAITQPIRIEDAVVVENEWGWIEEITSTFVVVRLWDLRRMVVPLSYFMEKPFQNWTREGSAIIGSVLIYLDYTAPVERIRAKAQEIAEASKLWDRKVISVQVTDAKPPSLELRVLVSAQNASAAFDLRCELREKLIAFVQAEIPWALPRSRNESVLPGGPNRATDQPTRREPRPPD
jgi:small-conductance mechanosensitive channel